MKTVVLLVVLALSGCASRIEWPVDELERWNGKSEAWVIQTLGSPLSREQINQPIQDIGQFQGVQKRIEKEYPGYSGQVRRMNWKKRHDNYLVLLIDRGGSWIVLDAVKWKDGVEF